MSQMLKQRLYRVDILLFFCSEIAFCISSKLPQFPCELKYDCRGETCLAKDVVSCDITAVTGCHNLSRIATKNCKHTGINEFPRTRLRGYEMSCELNTKSCTTDSNVTLCSLACFIKKPRATTRCYLQKCISQNTGLVEPTVGVVSTRLHFTRLAKEPAKVPTKGLTAPKNSDRFDSRTILLVTIVLISASLVIIAYRCASRIKKEWNRNRTAPSQNTQATSVVGIDIFVNEGPAEISNSNGQPPAYEVVMKLKNTGIFPTVSELQNEDVTGEPPSYDSLNCVASGQRCRSDARADDAVGHGTHAVQF